MNERTFYSSYSEKFLFFVIIIMTKARLTYTVALPKCQRQQTLRQRSKNFDRSCCQFFVETCLGSGAKIVFIWSTISNGRWHQKFFDLWTPINKTMNQVRKLHDWGNATSIFISSTINMCQIITPIPGLKLGIHSGEITPGIPREPI